MMKTTTFSKWRNMLLQSCVAGALTLTGFSASAADLDLQALIEAAKAEEPITVYASTGKIKKAAAAFTEKYGVTATGKKVKGAAQIELVIREAQANNTIGDVIISSDAASTLAELLPSGIVESWVPSDLAGTIPADSQDPLVVWRDPSVWTYNTEKSSSCPVSNIWELTTDKWSRKVAMPDPLNKPAYVDWFNQMESHWDSAMADAYKAHSGKTLDTSKESATAQWVQALAANGPLVTDSDSAVAEAIGIAGQNDPFFGIMATSKYREVKKSGLKLGLCADIKPYIGFANPSYGLIAKGTDSPNAAKLFVHFMMTKEGVSPMTKDGKVSGNSAVPAHAKETSGVAKYAAKLTPHNAATGPDDLDKRQDWQDMWRISYKR